MNKKIFLILLSVLLIIIFIAYIVNSVSNYNKSTKSLEEKTEEEINQLEEIIISMLNSLNNISFNNIVLEQTTEKNANTNSNNNSKNEQNNESSENSSNTSKKEEQTQYEIQKNDILLTDLSDLNWEYIKSNVEKIYNLWANLIVDLHELNVNNQDILDFSNTLDQVTLSIKQENKFASITNLVSLYSYLPKYMSQISNNEIKQNLYFSKNCILNTYALIEQQNWDEIKSQTASAIEYFLNIMNNIENTEQQNTNKITKIYVLLNELYSTIDLKDKELYYIKYRSTMEELMNY